MSKPLRVAILGGGSTGKSTLATALAAHYQTIWVREYLRDFVEEKQRTPRADEQFGIAKIQVARELAMLGNANGFLFCDTTPRMTAVYSSYYFGGVDVALDALAQAHTYDFTIVAAPTIPWTSDGLQRDSEAARLAIHEIVMAMLRAAAIPFLLVEGDLKQRVQQATNYLPLPTSRVHMAST
ncbi:MAG: ATP-binding protein [Burkholderiaceae bacterium]